MLTMDINKRYKKTKLGNARFTSEMTETLFNFEVYRDVDIDTTV